MVTATMDVRCVADVMDIVAMSALRMHGVPNGQAYRLKHGPTHGWFQRRVIVSHQFSRWRGVRCVRLIYRYVEACLLKFFFDIQSAASLKLA